MKIQIRQAGPSASEASIRSHKVRIDRPLDKGGSDDGPMGGELFLTAIVGCFMSTLLAVIKARQAEVSDVLTEVTAALADSPARFTGIEVCVSGACADPESLEKLVEIAERGCIMINTLRHGRPFKPALLILFSPRAV